MEEEQKESKPAKEDKEVEEALEDEGPETCTCSKKSSNKKKAGAKEVKEEGKPGEAKPAEETAPAKKKAGVIYKRSNEKKEAEVDSEKASSKQKNIKKEDDPNGTDFDAPKAGRSFPGDPEEEEPTKKLSAIESNEAKDLAFENKQVDDTDKALEELENEEKAPASKPFV